MARRLQGRPKGRRHHDARRHEDKHEGHGKAEGADSEGAGEAVIQSGSGLGLPLASAARRRAQMQNIENNPMQSRTGTGWQHHAADVRGMALLTIRSY